VPNRSEGRWTKFREVRKGRSIAEEVPSIAESAAGASLPWNHAEINACLGEDRS
jgi:hypothetical protein